MIDTKGYNYKQVYVDGKERGTVRGDGMLSQDWGYKAAIGHYDFDDRILDGWLDEFIIFDYALSDEQVFELIGKLRCSENKTTTEINAYKYQGINLKRSLSEENDEKLIRKEIVQKKDEIRRTNWSYKW